MLAQAIEAPEKIELAYDAYERAIALAPTIALTYQQYADLALRSGDGVAAAGTGADVQSISMRRMGLRLAFWAGRTCSNGNLTAAQRCV